MTTLLERDAYSTHRRGLGIVGGLGLPPVKRATAASDLLVVFGAGLNHFTTQHGSYTAGKTIIHVDTDLQAFGLHVEADVPLLADSAEAAAAIAQRLRRREREEWAATLIEDSRHY